MGEATVQEPLHLKQPRHLLVQETSADGKLSTIALGDLGITLDPCEKMCAELVAAGWSPVEKHTRPFLWTRGNDPQIYATGWAYTLMQEEKAVSK